MLLQLLLCGGRRRRRLNDNGCELVLGRRERCHRISSHHLLLRHTVESVIWRESWRCLDYDGRIQLRILLLLLLFVFFVAHLFALLRG